MTHWRASIGGLVVVVRLGVDGAGRVVDVHASLGPPGNPLSVLLESVCAAASVSLRAGVPLSAVMAKWRGQKFEPAGETGDPRAPRCSSVVDYLARSIEAEAGELLRQAL